MHRGPDLLLGEDLRRGGVGTGLQRVAGGELLLQFRGFPGPAGQYQVPAGAQSQTGVRAYPERLGAGPSPDHDSGDGELPERGWEHYRAGDFTAVHGDGHYKMIYSSAIPLMISLVIHQGFYETYYSPGRTRGLDDT